MRRLLVLKNKIRIPHRQSKVLPNNLVLVNSQELGSKIQINEVRKMSKNLSFSITIHVLLTVFKERKVEDIRMIKNIGKLRKLRLILGR